jgi:membrane-associated phospholipid phosphatase
MSAGAEQSAPPDSDCPVSWWVAVAGPGRASRWARMRAEGVVGLADQRGEAVQGLRRGGRLVPRAVPADWWFDGLLVVAFAALTAGLVWWPALLKLDLVVRDWSDAHRPPAASAVAQALDYVGQGGPAMTLTLLVAFWLAWRWRTVRPILPAGLAPIVSTVSIVTLKRWSSRGAPHDGSVRLFSGSQEVHYPSGHVSNGVVYYAVLALLLAPFLSVAARRQLQWLPGLLVLVATTYIGYHWITDSVAGYLLGLFLVRLLLRVPWTRIRLPPRLDRPP